MRYEFLILEARLIGDELEVINTSGLEEVVKVSYEI